MIPADASPKLEADRAKTTPQLSEKMFVLIQSYNHSILQKCTLKREAFDLWADADEIVNPFSIFTDDNDEFLQSRIIAVLIDEIKRLKAQDGKP